MWTMLNCSDPGLRDRLPGRPIRSAAATDAADRQADKVGVAEGRHRIRSTMKYLSLYLGMLRRSRLLREVGAVAAGWGFGRRLPSGRLRPCLIPISTQPTSRVWFRGSPGLRPMWPGCAGGWMTWGRTGMDPAPPPVRQAPENGPGAQATGW